MSTLESEFKANRIKESHIYPHKFTTTILIKDYIDSYQHLETIAKPPSVVDIERSHNVLLVE